MKLRKKKRSEWKRYIPRGRYLLLFFAGIVISFMIPVITSEEDSVWTLLERVEIFISAFTIVFAYMTWVRVKNRDSYFLDMQIPDDNEVHACLVIHIGTEHILSNISSWCNSPDNNIKLKDLSYSGENRIDHERFVVEIPKDLKKAVFIRTDMMPDGDKELQLFHNDLQKALSDAKSILNTNGVTSIHLFYKGPVACGFYIGGFLDNKGKVYVYHYSKTTGKYKMAGELNTVTKNLIEE